MKTPLKLALACLCLSGLPACDINHLWDKDYLFEVTQPQDGVLIYDCSSYTQWHFFSFDADSVIGSFDAADSAAYEVWRNRTDWDLAFHRQNIKTNSGASGVGMGGVLLFNQQSLDFDAVTEAPDDGYTTDSPDSIIYDMSQMMQGIVTYIPTGLAQPLKDWATLTDMLNSVWTYVRAVFIVRTANGNYAKILLSNFKSDTGLSGTITMRYVYQPDGTTNLDNEPIK